MKKSKKTKALPPGMSALMEHVETHTSTPIEAVLAGKPGRKKLVKPIEIVEKALIELATGATKASDKALKKIMDKMNKQYGEGTLMTLSSGGRTTVSAVKSGWPDFDDLLTGETDDNSRTKAGTGIGIPRGRIMEIYGPAAGGKTTLSLHLIKAFQQVGLNAAFVDAEHALDVRYAKSLGVDMQRLVLNQPDSGEQALDLVRELTRSKAFGIIVVDSVAALVPQAEQEKEMHESVVAVQARMMSRAMRILTKDASDTDTLIVFINQIRAKVGVFFGSNETTPGGSALKFAASIRLDIRNVKTLKKGDRYLGHRARIKTVKNKCAPPHREVFADIVPNKGIVVVHGEPPAGVSGRKDD